MRIGKQPNYELILWKLVFPTEGGEPGISNP